VKNALPEFEKLRIIITIIKIGDKHTNANKAMDISKNGFMKSLYIYSTIDFMNVTYLFASTVLSKFLRA